MRKLLLPVLSFITFNLSAQEKVDAETINRIIAEEKNNSKVMDIAYQLTDVCGPRLTNSPGWYCASNYAADQLKKWGLDNVQLEEWGNFGKGWEVKRNYIALTAPYYKPIIGYPKTWTKSTNGLVNAEVVLVSVKDSTELNKYAGKLAGKIVLTDRNDFYKHSFKADATRYTDAELDSMANIKPDTSNRASELNRFARFIAMQRLTTLVKQMAEKEGAVAMLTTGLTSHDGTVFAQNPTGLRTPKEDGSGVMLEIAVAYEDFMMLCRFAKENITAKVELDIQSQFTGNETKAYNVIGEIKGSDPKLKNEVVMLGAHLDSWHTGTGATDNASGSAVMMEVMRLFKVLNLQPRLTIRIALWSGEEHGLLGSRGYVTNHFGDRKTMLLKPEQQLVSGYFNIDNGTGRVRGIYAEGNEKVKSIFADWLKPFYEMGAKTVTLDRTGGTDHIPFNEVGIPGFQFIQDDIEYDTRTHHSNMDVYDHLIADDLKQIATVVAAFVYNTAQRDEKLPRKDLSKPAGR